MASSRRSADNITPTIGTDSLQDLRILEAIQENPNISQRLLAEQLGTALGVVNACIHTLVRKGLIKIRGENNRSLTYHLTKRGVLHKSRLALEWTRNTINYYRDSRSKIAKALARVDALGIKTVALMGDEELVDLVSIIAGESSIKVVETSPLSTEIDAILVCSAFTPSEIQKIKTSVSENVKIIELF